MPKRAWLPLLALILAATAYIVGFPIPVGRPASPDALQAAWDRVVGPNDPGSAPQVLWMEPTAASTRSLLVGLDPGDTDATWTCGATPDQASICVDEHGGIARMQIGRVPEPGPPIHLDQVRSQVLYAGFDAAAGDVLWQDMDGGWSLARLARDGSGAGEASWLEVRYDALGVAEATRHYAGDAARREALASRSDAVIDASMWVFVVLVLFQAGPLVVGVGWLAVRRPRELFRPRALALTLALGGLAALLGGPLQGAAVVGGVMTCVACSSGAAHGSWGAAPPSRGSGPSPRPCGTSTPRGAALLHGRGARSGRGGGRLGAARPPPPPELDQRTPTRPRTGRVAYLGELARSAPDASPTPDRPETTRG